ncbi:MAG: hypothetical protein ACXABY_36185 [Candidatus Thorarchaeota archaeon]|jgi:hypothetical protein
MRPSVYIGEMITLPEPIVSLNHLFAALYAIQDKYIGYPIGDTTLFCIDREIQMVLEQAMHAGVVGGIPAVKISYTSGRIDLQIGELEE